MTIDFAPILPSASDGLSSPMSEEDRDNYGLSIDHGLSVDELQGLIEGFRPEAMHLICSSILPSNKTKSGIILPDMAKDVRKFGDNRCIVIAMGEGCFQTDIIKMRSPTLAERVRPGSVIVQGQKVPPTMFIGGRRFVLIQDDWIMGTVDPDTARKMTFSGERF